MRLPMHFYATIVPLTVAATQAASGHFDAGRKDAAAELQEQIKLVTANFQGFTLVVFCFLQPR